MLAQEGSVKGDGRRKESVGNAIQRSNVTALVALTGRHGRPDGRPDAQPDASARYSTRCFGQMLDQMLRPVT